MWWKKRKILSDDTLVEMIRTADKGQSSKAVEVIYFRVRPIVERVVRQNSGVKEDVEDVLQDTMLKFYLKVVSHQFQADSPIEGFFKTVGKNLWLDRLRRKKKGRSIHSEILHEQNTNENSTILPPNKAELLQLLDLTGKSCQKILELWYFYNWSPSRIADQLHSNEQSIRTRRVQCIRQLRSALKTQSSN